MLSIQKVSKSFLTGPVLEDFSFDFKDGVAYGIGGPNGSGKTVLLKILAGIYSPDTGVICLNDQSLRLMSPADAIANGIVYVPQIPFLPEHLTFRDIGELIGTRLGGILIDDISPDRRVNELIPEERQVLECELALARNPRVLLLDEPRFLSGSERERHWNRLLHRIRDSGAVLIVVLHDSWAAHGYLDQMLHIVRNGFVDATEQTSGQPRHGIVATVDRAGLDGLITDPGSPSFGLYCRGTRDWSALITDLQSQIAQGVIAVMPGHLSDRGLALECSIAENLALVTSSSRNFESLIGYGTNRIADRSRDAISRYSIRPAAPRMDAGDLSGGNKQKLAIARALEQRLHTAIVVNPTRGLDTQGIAMLATAVSARLKGDKRIIVLSDDSNDLGRFPDLPWHELVL